MSYRSSLRMNSGSNDLHVGKLKASAAWPVPSYTNDETHEASSELNLLSLHCVGMRKFFLSLILFWISNFFEAGQKGDQRKVNYILVHYHVAFLFSYQVLVCGIYELIVLTSIVRCSSCRYTLATSMNNSTYIPSNVTKALLLLLSNLLFLKMMNSLLYLAYS